MNSIFPPSQTETDSVLDVLHGVDVEDRFRWLEDQDSPATRAFIRAEREVYRGYLQSHGKLRTSIEARVRELLTVESVDLPIPDRRGGLLYLKRRAEEEQKGIYRQDDNGRERLVLSNELLGRDAHSSLAILQVSREGRYLVFALRTGGEDVQEVGFYDLEQWRLLSDRLPRGFYRGLVIDKNGSGFYYAHEETEGHFRSRRAVRRHIFGRDLHTDEEVFYAGEGPSLRLILQGNEDGSSLGYLIASLESEPRARFLIHKLPPAQPPEPVIDLCAIRFGARFRDRSIEALTTYGAPFGRIVSISPERPLPEEWKEIVPERRERIDTYQRWGDAIVAHYLDGPVTTTRVHSDSGELLREINYPEEGTSTLGQIDPAHNRLFYSHSDITEPPTIYAVDLRTGERILWWPQDRSSQYPKFAKPVIEKHTYSSKDGALIPMTLVHRDGAKGIRPVLLSAYGGGGVNNTPKFSVLLTVLVEAGFSCATAHVRGGGEGGPGWHLGAQKQNKQISVDDLLAAADWLHENAYTTPNHLGVAGQSNGALLTLCAITQEPQLFRAAMALGPLADLTRFHLFGVARSFTAELGCPDDPEEFAALYRLSPYHRVRQDAHYPAVLVISGDKDKRCDSLHARKMIARLREAPLREFPALLDYTEHRGHKPVLPLEERIQALADRLTFLIAELSVVPMQEQKS